MRAILIDPTKATITETEIPDEEHKILPELQAHVKGSIELATVLPNGDDLFVNEEGLFKFTDFFSIGAHQPFAGPGIIVGRTSAGNTKACTSSLEYIKSRVTFSGKFIP